MTLQRIQLLLNTSNTTVVKKSNLNTCMYSHSTRENRRTHRNTLTEPVFNMFESSLGVTDPTILSFNLITKTLNSHLLSFCVDNEHQLLYMFVVA